MMRDRLKEYIATGNEIKFRFKDKDYFITYTYDRDEKLIIFYEYYKEELEVRNVDELLQSYYNGYLIEDIIKVLRDEDVFIY